MKFIKYIKSLIIFLLIFFVGEFLIEYGLDKILETSSFRYSRLYTTSLDNDVIAVGNSRGVNSIYSPYFKEKYGLKIMNLSYNGLKSDVLIALLKDYLDLHKKPKTILIEVSNLFGENLKSKHKKIPHSFSIYTKYSKRFTEKFENDHNKSSEIYKYFSLYRYNSELLGRNIYYIFNDDQMWINRYRINDKMIENTLAMDEFTLNIDIASAKSLREFVSKAERINVRLILFIAPYLPDYKSKMSNFDKIKKDLTEILNQPIIDLSDLISDRNLFADRVHSNELGSEIIADTLFQVFREK